MGNHTCMGNRAAGDALGLVTGEWINGQWVRNEVPGTASPGTEENGKTVERRLALRRVGKALRSAGEWRSRE